MTEQSNRWGVIINFTSGKKKFHDQWDSIAGTLLNAHIDLEQHATEYAGHAIELARQLVERGFRNLLVVGGDGTLNEVINGIYKSAIDRKDEITLAMLPHGTGNDWGRYWGMRRGKTPITEIIERGKRVRVDIGRLRYKVEDDAREHFFLNGMGFGIDAKVCYFTDKLKSIFGGHHWLYTVALLCSVFTHRSQKLHAVDENGNEFNTSLFTASIGNGCYSGGGLKQTDGDPTDGKMFATLIANPDLFKIIHGLGQLFKGRLWDMPIATAVQSRRLTIHTERSLIIETDGIVYDLRRDTHRTGRDIMDYQIDMIPCAIQMVVP